MRSLLRSWLPVGVAFLVGSMLTGVAGGHAGSPAVLHSGHSDTMNGKLTVKSFKFKSPKVGKLVVPGAAFWGCCNFGHPANGVGAATLGTGNTAVAPVNLPEGAVVTKVQWFHDDAEVSNSRMKLLSAKSDGTAGTFMAEVIPGICGSLPCFSQDTTITSGLVNNYSFHYLLEWWSGAAGPGSTTYKVVITYRVNNPGTE